MKDIPGFEGRYAVTEDGRVWSYKKCDFLKWMIGTHGYPCVELGTGSRKSKRCVKSVHRLVAETFLPNPKRRPEVNHIDSNRANPHIKNLEWVNRTENMAHANAKGRIPKGQDKTTAKLTESDVIEIRQKYKFWKYTMNTLAIEYRVSLSCIQSILVRRNWKHIA